MDGADVNLAVEAQVNLGCDACLAHRVLRALPCFQDRDVLLFSGPKILSVMQCVERIVFASHRRLHRALGCVCAAATMFAPTRHPSAEGGESRSATCIFGRDVLSPCVGNGGNLPDFYALPSQWP